MGQFGRRFDRFDGVGIKAGIEDAASVCDRECSLLGTQSSHGCCAVSHLRPHFLTACAHNCTFELREITAQARAKSLTFAKKIQFLVGPKIIRITAYFS